MFFLSIALPFLAFFEPTNKVSIKLKLNLKIFYFFLN